jgi:hypothetical protein
MNVDEMPVSPEFFGTMRVPLLAGRTILSTDLGTSAAIRQAEY